MKLLNYETEYYLDKLRKGEKFTYGKFGDGELFAVYKHLGWLPTGGANCDGHAYFPKMGAAIHKTFLNEKGYMKGTAQRFLNKDKTEARQLAHRYLSHFNIDIDLHNADFSFYKTAQDGELGKIKEVLDNVNYVIVSDERKKKLPIKYKDFICVSPTNCWNQKDWIKNQMIEMCDKIENPVFGLSMGMASLVVQDELYPIIGDKCTMISFGSIWDPFVQGITRSYQKSYINKSL